MTSNLLQFVEVGELAADALGNIHQLHLRGREGSREEGEREGGREELDNIHVRKILTY